MNPAVAQSVDPYPTSTDEAIARISDEERARVAALRERILESTAKTEEAAMNDYIIPVPKAVEGRQRYRWSYPESGARLDMVAIRGGEFLMGSPPDEPGRDKDEGPQVRVKISPFWMARFETTWNLYEPFMITNVARNKDGSPAYSQHLKNAEPVDLVSSPTTPYTEMSFGMGTDGFPAICMTHHAANKFCEWLSFQTGHFYRLPTEAEWEYACRAGTTGPYSCPTEELERVAVLDPEQVRLGYEKIGTKKPNPWGLHDMHGNVMEWCLDQYRGDAYQRWKGDPIVDPLARPETRHPRVARGGSWYDPEEELRSARRIPSEANWQIQDPQKPRSLWYLSDAHWLGFRVVRPLAVPSVDEMLFAWNNSFLDEAEERPNLPR
ncbi:MAG: formylglycine-generating enzyme family protein [Verrucomicrobiae bacterium]|nr:formylglycine-generating enzyme family protein [Verrucomicrobiae bacterium]